VRRTASFVVGALLLAGVGLAIAMQRGDGGGPRPDGDLDPAGAEAGDASEVVPPAGGRSITATVSGGSGSRVRRPGEPGGVRVAVRRGDDGSAVPDVSLVLEGTPPGGVPFVLQAWTDHDGRTLFDRVPEGEGYRLVTQLGAATPVERKGIAVVAGLVTDVGTVVLLSAGIVLGMVVREDGSPIEDAVVTATTHPDTLFDLDMDAWPLPPEPPFFASKTVTDLAGHFRLAGVPPGLVAIRATALGFRGRTVRTWVPPQATSPGSDPSGELVRGLVKRLVAAQRPGGHWADDLVSKEPGDAFDSLFVVESLWLAQRRGAKVPAETFSRALSAGVASSNAIPKSLRRNGFLPGTSVASGVALILLTKAGTLGPKVESLDEVKALPLVAQGMAWIDRHFEVAPEPLVVAGARARGHSDSGWAAWMYATVRLGRLLSIEEIGGRRWYADGCRRNAELQGPGGDFEERGPGRMNGPVRTTVSVLLFLARATPSITEEAGEGR